MNNDPKNSEFSYTYSAKEQAELRRIREKYQPEPSQNEDILTHLRQLDAGVTKTAQIVALTLGILGTLILGFGMSLCMSDLYTLFALTAAVAMPLGIGIGILGAVIVSIAYPVHNLIIRQKRKKLAPEILRLTDEILK